MRSHGIKATPEATLRRLTHYHHLLKQLEASGRPVVSCTHIAEHLRLLPIQVRKDMAMTGVVGKPKVGYEVPFLRAAIEEFLGWNDVTSAFLVGAGHLGTALLGYDRFSRYGLDIVAAFDVEAAKIGTTIHGKEVLPLEKLPDLGNRMHVPIGILTVPAEAAQSVVDLMMLSCIRAIWNFTPVKLEVPEGIIVENEDLSATLGVLSSKLAKALKRERLTQEYKPCPE